MAPIKTTKPTVIRAGAKTRSQNHEGFISKRKAEESPEKRRTKRKAFCELTNDTKATGKIAITAKGVAKENINVTLQTKVNFLVSKDMKKPLNEKSLNAVPSKGIPVKTIIKPVQVDKARAIQLKKIEPAKPKIEPTEELKEVKASQPITGVVTRGSLAKKSLNSTCDSTLYSSALEELSLEDSYQQKSKPTSPIRPENVPDVDSEGSQDVSNVCTYVKDIFKYLKEKEKTFVVANYFSTIQTSITTHMRSVLVDYMVELQDKLETNHEALYLGVKVVDLFLSRECVDKEDLQLLGVTAFFVATKYEETVTPYVSELVYMGDQLFTAEDILDMEQKLLSTIDWQLGIPLSYSFLRRYARCAKFEMDLLTLARYILEYNLMDFNSALTHESKLAAAALYLAIRMQKVPNGWSPTLEYYSGYKVSDFKDIAVTFNRFLKKDIRTLKNIRHKYSSRVFFKVSHIPLISDEEV